MRPLHFLALGGTVAVATVVAALGTGTSGGAPTPVAPLAAACCTTETPQEPPGEARPLLQVVEAAVGEDLTVRAFQGKTELAAGEWLSAEFGDMEGNVYHAPDEMPPMGLDTIRILDNSGTYLGFVAVQFVPAGGYVPRPAVVVHPPTEGYETSTDDNEIVAPIERQPCPRTDIPSVSGVVAPVNLPEDPDEARVAQMSRKAVAFVVSGSGRTKGKKPGIYPAPVGGCTKGATRIESGPWKVYKQGTTISASVSLSTLGNDSSCTYWKMVVWKVQHRDHYKCVDGKWKYLYSEKRAVPGAFAWAFDPNHYVHPVTGTGTVLWRTHLGYDALGYKFESNAVSNLVNPAPAGG